MPKLRILSAESHVVEPADLWTQGVDRRYRTRAPHVVKEVAGIESDWFVFEGLRPFPVAGLGVAGEFIYPSIGMFLYALADAELRAVCLRAYNDWIAEFCRHDPARLAGAALIPQDGLPEASSEVRTGSWLRV